jgi:flagellar biosynthesis chaperone FliJ
MRASRIHVLAVLGLAFLAAPAASGASPFAKSMNRICHAASKKVAGIGISESLSELTTNEPQLLAADRWKLARMAKLGAAPTGVAKPFATYVAMQQQIDTLEGKIARSAKHVQLATVLKLQTETDRLQKRQDAAARTIGAAACLSTAS